MYIGRSNRVKSGLNGLDYVLRPVGWGNTENNRAQYSLCLIPLAFHCRSCN
jgi:hypothetical protein